MTAAALSRFPGSAVEVRGAASAAMRPVLTGPVTEGRVLGTSAAAAWLAVAGEVVVLTTDGAVRLPNAIALGVGPEARPFDMIGAGDPALVGSNNVSAPGLRARVVRWWDPRPKLAPATPDAVLCRIAEARAWVDPAPEFGLGAALAECDPAGVVAAARLLLGRGSGLTPEGDDLLAAALAAHRLVGEAVGTDSAGWLVDVVSNEIVAAALGRTTSLSASLVRLACSGYVADPVTMLFLALADRGDVAEAVRDLLAVGHSSGPALAAGVLLGAAAACGEVLR